MRSMRSSSGSVVRPMPRHVVVTGLGAVSALGVGVTALFDRWAAGECGIRDGEAGCRDFDPRLLLSNKEVRRTDRYTQFALVAAAEAIEQAGWDSDIPYPRERVACVIGTCFGGVGSLEQQYGVLARKGAGRVSAMMMPNAASGAVAMRYGTTGPSHCVASACAAGADAIGAGARLIRGGEADAAIVGGADAALTPLAEAASTNMGAVSVAGISRPFDRRRDGFVAGEGAGVLILEEGRAAAERGADVLGEILGFGATSDAHHITAPNPSGDGATRAMSLAMNVAGITATDVDYVNAHGTSTPLNDRVETHALHRALGARARGVPVSSTKSVIGHTMGAGGALEAIATLCVLRTGVVAPTVGLEDPDPELDLDYVPGTRKPLASKETTTRYALSNSFGFGGHNAVVCLSALPASASRI